MMTDSFFCTVVLVEKYFYVGVLPDLILPNC